MRAAIALIFLLMTLLTCLAARAALTAPVPAEADSEAATEAATAQTLLGEWMGTLDVGAAKLRLVLRVEGAEGGGVSATLDSVDQGAVLKVDRIALEGEELRFAIAPIGASFQGKKGEDGGSFDGTWSQGGQKFPLVLTRQETPFELKRPQMPQAPFPYASREVTFDNEADGVTLGGTLLLPEGEGPFPAVLFVTGSGPQDRDETLMGHKPFLVIADHLARKGIASLRYDDRGVGTSTGNHMGSTVDQFAGDVAAGVRFLAQQPKIDGDAVGILGHSEGGLTGPKAAVGTPEVDFLVLLAPPGVALSDLLERQQTDILTQRGIDEALVAKAAKMQREDLAIFLDSSLETTEKQAKLQARAEEYKTQLTDAEREALQINDSTIQQTIALAGTPWFSSLLTENPATYLEKIQVPVLALFAGKDLQVAAEPNAKALEAALAKAGNENVEIHTFPDLNHLFQHSETGAPDEYGEIEETVAPEVLERVGDWILGVRSEK